MQYEPIKNLLGRYFTKSLSQRKLLYFLLDLLLLRSWHVRKSLRRISESLPDDSIVLDAGSGFGQYSWRMGRNHRKWKITGLDINGDEIARCNDFMAKAGMADRIRFQTGDLTLLSEDEAYNLILTVDVMEHIEEDVIVFGNFRRALRKGGVLMISTPSDRGGSDVHGSADRSFIDEHVRDGYSIEGITAKLKSAGFSGIDARYTYGPAGKLSWILSMKIPVRLLNSSYLFFILLPFYYLVFFPFSMLLNFIDVSAGYKSGTGLIIIARK